MSWASKWWLHAKAMRHEVTILPEGAAGCVLSKKVFWKIYKICKIHLCQCLFLDKVAGHRHTDTYFSTSALQHLLLSVLVVCSSEITLSFMVIFLVCYHCSHGAVFGDSWVYLTFWKFLYNCSVFLETRICCYVQSCLLTCRYFRICETGSVLAFFLHLLTEFVGMTC